MSKLTHAHTHTLSLLQAHTHLHTHGFKFTLKASIRFRSAKNINLNEISKQRRMEELLSHEKSTIWASDVELPERGYLFSGADATKRNVMVCK